MFAILTGVGAATGAGAGLALRGSADEVATVVPAAPTPPPETNSEPEGHGAQPAAEEALAPLPLETHAGALAIVPFPPVLTNLAEPAGAWIRLEGSLVVDAEADEPQAVLVERAAEQIMTFVRTVALTDIEGPSGFLSFRSDLDDVVSSLSRGQVRQVILHSMVVE